MDRATVPAPVRRKLSATGVFAVAGGPAAWYLELNAGYALASTPCFAGTQRLPSLTQGLAWTSPLMTALLAVCTLIAFAAFWLSLRELQRSHSAGTPDSGRERFAALWGTVLGGGFCLATVATAAGLLLLPRCTG